MFKFLLVLGFISAAYPNTEDDLGGKSIKVCGESDCVIPSKCPLLKKHKDFKAVNCGNDVDTGVAKVCCPKWFPRVRRQTKLTAKKYSPYEIAGLKCVEYGKARYVTKITPSELPKGKPIITKYIDCPVSEPLVTGGKAAKLKEFPHMALIGFSDRSEKLVNDTKWLCGGTIISDRFVLTAAHCMKSGDFQATWVRLGELVYDNDSDFANPKDFRIREKIPHPKYTPSSVYYDIMLLKLDKIEFSPHMRPICLYASDILIPALNNEALITGWGATAADEKLSEELLKAKVNFADDKECAAIYRGDSKLANGFDPNSMLCAGNKQYGNDTCSGDSGGPLQVPVPDYPCMYYQVGITSYGSKICGRKNVPTLYTKVWAYIPWIQSIVWQ